MDALGIETLDGLVWEKDSDRQSSNDSSCE